MNRDRVQKHVFLSGRVQGVGFRYFTQKAARRFQVKGWVRNLKDGRVEVVMQGTGEAVEKMLEELEKGPGAANVNNLEIVDESDALKDFITFDVEPTV